MNPFRASFATLLLVLALGLPRANAATLNVPARATNALSGQQFVSVITSMAAPPDTQRENWIYAQIASGNVPNFIRTLVPITTNLTISGTPHTITYYVTPEYMAIGSDSDYFLEPMTPLLAQRLDTLLGTIRPTRKMVDQIAKKAVVHLQPNPIPPDPDMITVPYFNQHNTMVWTQRVATLAAHPLGSLVDGDKKDVIISPKIYTNFAQSAITKPVVIYGWHYPDGTFIQPEYNGHEETYADYSHGIRMVQNAIILDGTNTTITAVLTNPAIAAIISDETTFTGNVIPKPYYTVAAVAPLIITQPSSRAVGPGTNVQFSVLSVGDPTLSYTWKFNGSPIAGATDSVLTINNAQPSNAGTYNVVVTNASGTATSWNATLSVTAQTHPVLFADDFDSNSSANWNVFWGADSGVADYSVTWAYDYGATPYQYSGLSHLIPPSPHSTGSTRGVKLTVNTANAANAGVNIYPKNKNFSGNFTVKFDMWINYPGSANGAGAVGSTQFGIFGINHTGTRANWAAASATATDGLWFANDGDGGTTHDYRAYLGNLGGTQTELIGASSGLTSSTHTAAIYQTLFPTPPNESIGAPGKNWVSVEIDQTNNNVTVLMNGTVIAQRTNTSAFSNGTIMLGLMDVFSSVASPVAESYVIFDNLTVEDLSSSGVAPSITSQPQTQSVPLGSPATFTVSATGSSLAYQWQFNGNDIAGATTSAYTIASAQKTNIGYYTVVVTNSLGTATSASANLSISGYYLDRFDANTSANWVTNTSSADNRITWNFDYSTVGIPQLNGSSSPRALKMEANLSAAAIAAINLSPKNQSFTGDYQLRFNVWLNFIGPAPAGGTGSTEAFTASVGTTGDRVQWAQAGNTANGVLIAANGDGGSSPTSGYPDYAMYTNATAGAASTLVRSNSGLYAAPNNVNPSTYHGNTYYTAAFPGKTVPSAQTALAPSTQTGTANGGSLGFSWHEVILKKVGNIVAWSIDNVKIASVTNAVITGNNVSIGYMDPFASVAQTNFEFGLFANFRIEPPGAEISTAPTITAQPQSTSVSPGATATFSVSATSASPLRYQWQKNGGNIAGATASTLSIVNAQQANGGSYHVLVFNDFNYVTSADATLTVLQGPTHLQAMTLNSDRSVTTTWTADGVSTYTLQYKSNLTDSAWLPLNSYVAAGPVLTMDDGPVTDAQRFYQLASDQHLSDIAGVMNFTLLGNSDNFVSLPLVRGPSTIANISSVSANVISVTGTPWTSGQFVYSANVQSNTYYARFISGALTGRIFDVTDNTENTVTLNLGTNSLDGIAQGDQFSVEPYWTLATAFPSGAGVNVSPTQGNRNTEILIPDQSTAGVNLSAARIYYFNAGLWKQVGQGAANHNDDVLPMNAHFIIRHNVATNTSLSVTGLVVSNPLSVALQSSSSTAQDNYVGLARPVPMTLNNSGLISSGAFAASPLPGTRTDELLTFDNTVAQKNKSSSAVYYYWNNAWRRVGSGTTDVGDTAVFTPGNGVIIRKGTNSPAAVWSFAPTW